MLDWLEFELNYELFENGKDKKFEIAEKICKDAGIFENSTLDANNFEVWKIYDLPSSKYLLLNVFFKKNVVRPFFKENYFTDDWMLEKTDSSLDNFIRACFLVHDNGVRMYVYSNNREHLSLNFLEMSELFTFFEEEEPDVQDESSDILKNIINKLISDKSPEILIKIINILVENKF